MSEHKYTPLSRISSSEINQLRYLRWKARTDLGFLCREILGYKDVSPEVHDVLISRLQQFPKPTAEQYIENDKIVHGRWQYKPITPMMSLPGKRRRLILDFRGALKTTINAQAHTIQWILNYPDIAMFVVQSNSEKAESIIGEIKKHFQSNPRFRQLFPEHCPQRKIFDWGTKGEFTTEARNPEVTRKEKTVMAGSIDKGSAGYHFDVIKFSDIVEPNNIVGDGITQVKKSFYMMQNLLVAPDYWIDVEGTRYDFSDLYGDIIDKEAKKPPEQKEYEIYVRGVFKKKTDDGSPQKFIPEELGLPDLLDEKGQQQSWWPMRFKLENLLSARSNDPFIFATQQLQNPLGNDPDMIPFPIVGEYPAWITREIYSTRIPIAYKEISIDTAQTVGLRSNSSAIVVGAVSGNGKTYVDEIIWGKWLPDQLVNKIVGAVLKHKPLYVKIEETGFVLGLMPALRRMMDQYNLNIPIKLIKRDNQTKKQERILNTLQPWYKNKDLIFLDDITCKEQLLKELSRFPAFDEDDILDAISDLFQDRQWFGREIARKPIEKEMADLQQLYVMDPEAYMLQVSGGTSREVPDYYNRTGGL